MKKLFVALFAILTLCTAISGKGNISREADILSDHLFQVSDDGSQLFVSELEDVTVRVTAEKGRLPENVELVVLPVKEDSENYYRTMSILEEHVPGEHFSLVFDIFFRDMTSGQKIEPNGNVDVTIDLTTEALERFGCELKADEFSVFHITDDNRLEIVATGDDFIPGSVVLNNSDKDKALHTSFITDSFSTYTITWGRNGIYRALIHYGYMNNGTFVEFNESQFSHGVPHISRENVPNYLIYDVEGYVYDYAYLNTPTVMVEPFLTSNSTSNYRYWPVGNGSYEALRRGDNIYIVYKKAGDPAPAGSATLQTPDDELNDEKLSIHKESVDNEDGTRTISLTVKGEDLIMPARKLADVIIVWDISGSMDYDLGSQSRMDASKDSISWFVNQLLSPDMVNYYGDKLNRVALVTFSNRAEVVTDLVDNPALIDEALASRIPSGGTNWEEALQVANRITVDSERETFIVFVTDGNPTWRMTRYDVSDQQLRSQHDIYTSQNYSYYRNYHVFGQGSSDDQGRNRLAALTEAINMVELGKHFYAIGVSDDVSGLEQFVEQTGSRPSQCFSVYDEEDLLEALHDIYEKITAREGFVNIQISDGITPLTNLTAKTPVQGLDSADCFKYYKKTPYDTDYVEWDPASEGVNYARYNPLTGAVEWDFGENYMLSNDTDYKVEFLVWPSQQAFDIITALNNGEITYDSLPYDIKEQISLPSGGGYYTLKTNIDPICEYQHGFQIGSRHEIYEGNFLKPYNDVEPLQMKTMHLNVEKIFLDSLTDGADRPDEIRLMLQRRPFDHSSDWEDIHEFILNGSNSYSDSIEISPGLATEHDGERIYYNQGYEYRVLEEFVEYHYEFRSEIVRPVLVNFSSEELQGDNDGNNYLTGTNTLKGGINISKYVVDETGKKLEYGDFEYVIKGYILGPDGEPFTFDNSLDTRTDKSTSAGASAAWLEHCNDNGAYHIYDENGYRIGYKMHFDSTAQIELHLKADMLVRFINLPAGCTYYFYEDNSQMPVCAEFFKIEAENLVYGGNETPSSEGVPQPTVSGNGVSGIVYGDTEHNVSVYNRIVDTSVGAEKKWAKDGQSITPEEGSYVIFSLMNGDTTVYDFRMDGSIVTAENAETFTYLGVTGRAYSAEAWKATFDWLPKYDEGGSEIHYTIRETWYPAAYLPDVFEVEDGGVITNNYNLTDIEVEKVWTDDNNASLRRPQSITVALNANGAQQATVTLDQSNSWKHTFEDYPVLDNNHQQITYTVEEVKVPEFYRVEYSNEGYKFIVENILHTTEITAQKKWKNADGSDDTPEDAVVTFTLMNGDTEIASLVIHGFETAAGDEVNFEYLGVPCQAFEDAVSLARFKYLPIYDENGNEIHYTVRETVSWPGYRPDVTEVENGGVITNICDITDIEVNKVWKDDDDHDKIRPLSVTIALCAGEETLEEVTLSEELGWSHVFEGYPIYDEDWQVIEYSIKEIDVPEGYTETYSGSNYSFTVTNTHIPVPDTGDRNPLAFWGVVSLESALCMVLMILFKRNKERKSVSANR